MVLRRATVLSTAAGFLFVVLGFITTPGLGGRTVMACSTSSAPAFRGIRFSDVTLVWYDGCNVWTFSLFAALGGLLLIGAVVSGSVTVVRAFRNSQSQQPTD